MNPLTDYTVARYGCVYWIVDLGRFYFWSPTQWAKPVLIHTLGES